MKNIQKEVIHTVELDNGLILMRASPKELQGTHQEHIWYVWAEDGWRVACRSEEEYLLLEEAFAKSFAKAKKNLIKMSYGAAWLWPPAYKD